jgi:EAL domain-containing protein (putative c-di-GMP-specific phosphodiesterase class I)
LRKKPESENTSSWTVAENVSARLFHQEDFVERVAETLKETRADPSRLKLERAEGIVIEDLDSVTKRSPGRCLLMN